MRYQTFMYSLILFGVLSGFVFSTPAADFNSSFPKIERTWVGPEYWTNRLQDWKIQGGRLHCLISAPNRSAHLLTHQLSDEPGAFEMRVQLGTTVPAESRADGWAGFRIGAQGPFGDYRDNAVFGQGLHAGITTDGYLFIRNENNRSATKVDSLQTVELRLYCRPSGDAYEMQLSAHHANSGIPVTEVRTAGIQAHELVGNLALVSAKHNFNNKSNPGEARFWFADWQVSGEKVEHYPSHAFGPVLFNQYTLSNDIMKMTAQMPPIGEQDSQSVRLQIQQNGGWETIAEEAIDAMARTATFRIENWNSDDDVSYRLAYSLVEGDGQTNENYYTGTIRHEPLEKDPLVVAGFTGNTDYGFPNTEIVAHLKVHQPDMLVFTGDQLYEGVGGFGVQRRPIDKATLDYLRKWYLFGWSFGELMKDRPTVCLPDDHDVYHGNIWGMAGKKAEGEGKPGQDSGGYKMPANWVNMVQRTQISHLPDPYDPTPVLQGIGVYYCNMDYAGISFAIIEDRKFKSSPSVLLPEGNVVNGWALNKEFDAEAEADVPGAVLLGQRQLDFLDQWVDDWNQDIWMKTVISQTIFANVATLPKSAVDDDVVPGLRILHKGEYAENDVKVADMDSNSWPQTPRNKALRIIRKAFAFHLAGDQHLGSTIQYGVDEYHDAPFAFCVPAVANLWPRRWYPSEPGKDREPGSPKYSGDFEDGFGNKMTVHAVSNPYYSGKKPSILYDRATGYGIVKFSKSDRTITMECWPRYADPSDPSGEGQYKGWPITIHQMENYNGEPYGYLPRIEVEGMENPLVQIIDESKGESVYTIRIQGNAFRPKVFENGNYTVKVGEFETGEVKEITGVKPAKSIDVEPIQVRF